MKKLFQILLIFLWSTYLFSQDTTLIQYVFPTEDNDIVYKEVVNVDSTQSVKSLRLNAKEWVAQKFNSIQDVIQIDDDNTIIMKAFIKKGHNVMLTNPKMWFTLKIEFREGRYRYNLSSIVYEFDINHMGVSSYFKENLSSWLKYSNNKNKRKRDKINIQLEKFASEINAEFEKIIKSLKESMINNTEDEW